jgi:transmembrane sensor
MPSERIILLLAKRNEGLCTAAELQELDEWYASFSPLENRVTSTERIKKSLYSRIRSQLHLPHQNEESEIVPLRSQLWLRSLAACVALLLIGGVIFYTIKNTQDKETIIVATSLNETTKIVLPDSSIVRLKPGSKIHYDPNLGNGSIRELFLEGEGFFEISHNAARPFVVHASDLDIRVLGTVFNVKSAKNTPTVETTLFQGSVRIEKDNGTTQLITLTPNQRAVYSKESQKIKVDNFPEFEEVVAGKADKSAGKILPMIFDEKPMEELFTHMEVKFGVNIYIHNRSELTCPITADLEKENLDEILNLLKISYGIDYALYGTELFIEGSICNK